MYENLMEMFIKNSDNYKGNSLCIYSDSTSLNKKFIEDILNGIENFNILDCLEIMPEKNVIKMQEVKNISEFLSFKPNYSDKKIVIIHEIDKMNNESANAFLKTLEEPPEFSIIIVTSNKYNKLLPTIKSRLTKFKISYPKNILEKVEDKFKDKIQYIKVFSNYDFEILKYLYDVERQKIDDIIEEFENSKDSADYILKNLCVNIDSPLTKIRFVYSYYQFITILISKTEEERIELIEKIISKKGDYDNLQFLKKISELALIFCRDGVISKTSENWKYFFNYNLTEFWGTKEYKFDATFVYDNIKHFNKILSANVSNYNYDMEIMIHFLRINRAFFK
jgi:DNA polymerase-3 subunit delta'/DNA polymerase-3 subunit gamma/tau